MNVSGQAHVGITVSDIEKSIQFYRDVLGMTLMQQGEASGEKISRIVGVPGTSIKTANLSAGNLILELFQYIEPSDRRQKASLRQYDVGHYHLAFLVDDIDTAYEELTSKGARFSDEPQRLANGGRAIYFWDPHGVALELIQQPKK